MFRLDNFVTLNFVSKKKCENKSIISPLENPKMPLCYDTMKKDVQDY